MKLPLLPTSKRQARSNNSVKRLTLPNRKDAGFIRKARLAFISTPRHNAKANAPSCKPGRNDPLLVREWHQDEKVPWQPALRL